MRYVKEGVGLVQVLATSASLLELLQVGSSLLCIMAAKGCPSHELKYFVLCANICPSCEHFVLRAQGESCSALVLRAHHPSSVAFAKAPVACSEWSRVP